MVEENYNSSFILVIRWKIIGGIGERDCFEVLDIVLLKVDDVVYKDIERLKLFMIELKLGYL